MDPGITKDIEGESDGGMKERERSWDGVGGMFGEKKMRGIGDYWKKF